MAEGILKSKIDGLAIEVDSAGTGAYHVGDNPDYRAVVTARKYGVDISRLVARQFTVDDFDNFDVIYAMDRSNLQNILALARNENDKQKVKLFLDALLNDSESEVPDPYFGGDQGFEHVYNLIDAATDKIVENAQSA